MSAYSIRYVPDLDIVRILGRLIRNPNYGGPGVGIHGWTWRPQISKEAAKPGFKKALRESIAREGVRNPVLVWAFKEGIFLTFGGSRVEAARDCGIQAVPAIVNDYTELFHTCEKVTTENWTTFFTDIPRDAEFGKDGFDYHYNLERARRANHDPAGFAWLEGEPSFISKEFPWLNSTEYK